MMPIPRNKNYLIMIAVALLSVAAYSSTLLHGHVWDDPYYIERSSFIQDWRNLFKIFSPTHLYHPWGNLDVNRPVMIVSLIFDYAVWKLNPAGYHLTNVILHAANTLIFFCVLSSVFKDEQIRIIGSILFAIHPIHTEAVNAINFREDLLVTLFYLLSFNWFIKGLITNDSSSVWYLSFLCYALALLSKEMAITLPLILLLYLRTFPNKNHPTWIFPGYIAITLIYIAFLLYVKQFSGIAIPFEATRPLYERLFSSFVIAGRYLWLHFFPLELNADYYINDFIIFSARNIGIVLIMGLISTWTICKMATQPGSSFFMGWFFITLIPAMNIIPIANPIAERYTYLPSIGPITLIAVGCNFIMDIIDGEKKKLMVNALMIISMLFLFSLTANGNKVWADSISLWSDTIKKSPKNARAYFNLGFAYYHTGDINRAIFYYNEALELKYNYADAYAGRGTAYYEMGQHKKAIADMDEAISINPYDAYSYYNRGNAYYNLGNLSQAISDYKMTITLNPMDAYAYYNLGVVFSQTGNIQQATLNYQKAASLGLKEAQDHLIAQGISIIPGK